ncbi:MAG: hypothetical protein ABWZ98_05330, partial [Nakamurella sp.]
MSDRQPGGPLDPPAQPQQPSQPHQAGHPDHQPVPGRSSKYPGWVQRLASSDYLRNYGLGMVLVAVVVCFANVAGAAPGEPGGGWLNLLCLTVYLAAAVAAATRIIRGSSWRLLALLWLTALLAVSILLRTALPVAQVGSGADWSFGAFGFVAAV